MFDLIVLESRMISNLKLLPSEIAFEDSVMMLEIQIKAIACSDITRLNIDK